LNVFNTPNSELVDLITAVSTALAVVFAALSAWTSMQSAKAARGAVEEARLARRSELAPRLVLERDFVNLQFHWPHAGSLNGEPVFLSKKHWKDNSPSPPIFNLQNFGQSPALEVTIIWELTDPHGDLTVPDKYVQVGITHETDGSNESQPVQLIYYVAPDGRGAGLPLYTKFTVDVTSCSPGQIRTIEFPTPLLNLLFLRGLQYGSSVSESEEITVSAHVSSYSDDGERYERTFKWIATPFSYGSMNPVEASCHFRELAVHPKPAGPRFE